MISQQALTLYGANAARQMIDLSEFGGAGAVQFVPAA
jgi:hypothetical protein